MKSSVQYLPFFVELTRLFIESNKLLDKVMSSKWIALRFSAGRRKAGRHPLHLDAPR